MESASEGQSPTTTDEEDRAEHQEAGASSGDRDDRKTSAGAEDGESQQPASRKDGESQKPAGQDDGESQKGGEDQDDDEEGSSPNASIARAVEDVSALVGETVNDQDGRKIGEVKDVYAVGDDESPMWVTIESATGLGRSRGVFVPLARIKRQADEFRVPYSYNHIHESPEVESGDELSEEDDRALRAYYAIGLADQELVGSARSYASQVPDDDGPARKIDAESADRPARELDKTPPAERVAEAYEKQKEEEGDEHRSGREATAEDVFHEDGSGDSKEDSGEDESADQPKAEEKGSGEDGSDDQATAEKSEEQPKAEGKEHQPEAEEKPEQTKDEEKQKGDG